MASNDESTKIMELLMPFAANWSGTLKRGDVVIPKDDIPRLVEQLVAAARQIGDSEASDTDIFHVLQQASRSASLQNQVAILRHEFRITKKR